MNKKPIESYIDKLNPQLKQTIKEVYNKYFDTRVFSFEEIKLTEAEFDKIWDLTLKVNRGEDITFDLGYRYFRGIKLDIAKGVFVPQYDTEQIVDLALDKINEGKFLEIGAGSGAISLALVNESKLIGDSIDINPDAIKLCQTNLQKIENNNVQYILQDFNTYKPVEKYDLIISNPPYIVKGDPLVDKWVLENQPELALYAEDDGLYFYKQVFKRAPELLKKTCYIIMEIGQDQGEKLIALAKEMDIELEVVKDYNQLDRFIVARYHGK